jgi:hypothetical protein
MPKAGSKVPITLRALIQRLNRKLAHEGERLVATRTGGYYLIEGQRVVEKEVDLIKVARTLGVLRPWEEVR